MSADRTISSKYQVLDSEEVREADWAGGPARRSRSSQRPEGVLMVPVPEREALAGMARGANPEGYRDRNDRY